MLIFKLFLIALLACVLEGRSTTKEKGEGSDSHGNDKKTEEKKEGVPERRGGGKDRGAGFEKDLFEALMEGGSLELTGPLRDSIRRCLLKPHGRANSGPRKMDEKTLPKPDEETDKKHAEKPHETLKTVPLTGKTEKLKVE